MEVSFTPQPLYPQGKNPLVGPRAPARNQTPDVQPVDFGQLFFL